MSERIRGSYDDALYKSTCTLLYTLEHFYVKFGDPMVFEIIIWKNRHTNSGAKTPTPATAVGVINYEFDIGTS